MRRIPFPLDSILEHTLKKRDAICFRSRAQIKARGKARWWVVNPDGSIAGSGEKRNLIINDGMAAVKSRVWADCFTHCGASTGTVTTEHDSTVPGVQAKQDDGGGGSGTTITLDGSWAEVQTGRLIYYVTSGVFAKITGGSGTSWTADRSLFVDPKEDFIIYDTTLTASAPSGSEYKTNNYLTGSGNCGSSYSGGKMSMERTYDFPCTGVDETFNTLTFGWSGTLQNDVFSIISIGGGGVTVLGASGAQQLRVEYTLELDLTPVTLTAVTAAISGWTNTDGDEIITRIGINRVDSNGATQTSNFDLGGGVYSYGSGMEPSVSANVYIYIAEDSDTPSFGTAETITGTTESKGVGVSTGDYYSDKSVTFDTTEANGSSWRKILLTSAGDASSNCYVLLFDNTHTKADTHTLELIIRITWDWSF